MVVEAHVVGVACPFADSNQWRCDNPATPGRCETGLPRGAVLNRPAMPVTTRQMIDP